MAKPVTPNESAEPVASRRRPGPAAGPSGSPPPSRAPLPSWPELRGRSFDRLTDRARRALFAAHQEAERFKHGYVGTEHLLLGVVSIEDGSAAVALSACGVERTQVRQAVAASIGRGERVREGEPSLTPRARTALQLAVDEARRLSHSHVGTEHLLLGLLREGSGTAAAVLQGLNLKLEPLRSRVIQTVAAQAVRNREGPAVRSNVLTCRVDDRDLAAIDTLVEAGVRTTRSEAASWLIHAGIEANRALFAQVADTVAEVRRLRTRAQQLAQQVMGGGTGGDAGGGDAAGETGGEAPPPPQRPPAARPGRLRGR
ncbi:MAG TPA: Clp protease N-terminal domain-containing protein [Chloroflexota bacterium]|nr:Clp protease N-terminal domain-containing protein [Chloroflexota bacterium]